jgi:uncharacterized membrane protein
MVEQVVPVFKDPTPYVQTVAVDRPWAWLAAGWRDFMAAPHVSLACGAVVVVVSVLLTLGLWWVEMPYLVLPMLAGFMLVGPMMAIGLYEASRRIAVGERPTLGVLFTAWRRNPEQFAYMGLILALILLAWIRIATLIYAIFFSSMNPSFDRLIETLLFSSVSIPFLLVGSIVGLVLATIVFAISAVSIPMLLDREVSLLTALATSVTAVRANVPAMALWAALICLFTVFGLATFYVGLLVTMPLIGHATWHAYKDLVR